MSNRREGRAREIHAAGWSAGRVEAQRADALKVLKASGMPMSAFLAEQLARLQGDSEHLVDNSICDGMPGRGLEPPQP